MNITDMPRKYLAWQLRCQLRMSAFPIEGHITLRQDKRPHSLACFPILAMTMISQGEKNYKTWIWDVIEINYLGFHHCLAGLPPARSLRHEPLVCSDDGMQTSFGQTPTLWLPTDAHAGEQQSWLKRLGAWYPRRPEVSFQLPKLPGLTWEHAGIWRMKKNDLCVSQVKNT